MRTPAAGAAVLLSASLAACAASRVDVIQVGPWFQPRPVEEVRVLSSREETDKPWGAIAVLHGTHLHGRDRKSFEKQAREARRLAAEIGADAVIIIPEAVNRHNAPGSPRDGESGQVVLSGLALKYVENASTATRRAAP